MQILNINSLMSNSDTFLELFITYKYITSCHSWQFLIRSWCKSTRLTCIDLIKELYICMSQHFCVGMCFCGTAATKEFQNFCDLKPYRLSLVLFYNILFYFEMIILPNSFHVRIFHGVCKHVKCDSKRPLKLTPQSKYDTLYSESLTIHYLIYIHRPKWYE